MVRIPDSHSGDTGSNPVGATMASCNDWKKIVGDFECCSSCHWDWEEGYEHPCEVEDKDGNLYFVCCKAAALEEEGNAN